ncbi:hypothetical protein Q7P37_001721 [Cladosporium fusiforme]
MDASTSATGSASYASNEKYAAYVRQDSIRVARLDGSGTFEKHHASLRVHANRSRPILAFSPLRTSLVSVSTGARTIIWDIDEDAPFLSLYGSERSVTAAAWSHHDPNVVAFGHIDGRVSVWDLQHPTRPERIFYTGHAQCYSLSWSTSGPPMLAACSGQVLHVWEDCLSADIVSRRQTLDYPAQHQLWRPGPVKSLFTVAPTGLVEEWVPGGSAAEQQAADEMDQGLFGDLEDLRTANLTLSQRFVLQPAAHMLVIGSTGIVTLDRSGQSLRVYKDMQSAESNDPVWSTDLSAKADSMTIRHEDNTVKILAIGVHTIEARLIEPDVLAQITETPAGLGQEAIHKADTLPPDNATIYSDSKPQQVTSAQSDGNACISSGSERTQTQGWQSKTMRPIPVSQSRKRQKKIQRNSSQGRVCLPPSSRVRPFTSISEKSMSTAMATLSPREAMASRLEPPRQYEQESPMPFLSPTIPSQKASPSAIPALGDDIFLPPPENESFGSLPSTAMNDSDSDDEAFDSDALKGSGTLMMPGGANVPLPKSCGAFFSPNGQLVTFFPPKPKTKTKDIDGLSSSQPEERSTKASRLFPLFGNLAVEGRDYEDSDTESIDSQESFPASNSPDAKVFSFPSRVHESWPDRLGPMHGLVPPAPDQQSVVISVRSVNDIILFRPDIAREYKTSCNTDTAAADASKANAEVARNAGLEDSASIWSLLALLLHHKSVPSSPRTCRPALDARPSGAMRRQSFKGTPERAVSSVEDLKASNTDIISLGRQASRHLRTGSVATLGHPNKGTGWLASLSQTVSKLGSSWVVSEIFSWTESRADVQMLACLSAVLLSSAQLPGQQIKAQTPMFDSRSSLVVSDYFDESFSYKPSQPRLTPVLNADSRDGSFLNQSPAKPPYSSHVSSRNPSQPTTPYIDSLASTPPFPFPRLSHSGSRLSASGSASPEHHRSSFGAAAKYYAQSITDKISSYGTSPPAKRFGTSPNNELSSSLPGGSWSKSVSFASGVDHVHDNRSSTRLAPDDAYDSDRTIEDVSLPHTPKRYSGRISFTLKNVGAFVPPKRAQNKPQSQPLLSPLLAAKARIWISHYAEHLRRWDLDIQAAELDNIAGSGSHYARQPKHMGVHPEAEAKTPIASCSICHCKIRGVQHVCPHCLHTTHVACMKGFIDACGNEKMECPTGCGCACSGLSCDEIIWDTDEEPSAPPPTVKKKRSLTDPRIWRARVQGDSW